MSSNQTNHKARLAVAPETSLVEILRSPTFPLPGETQFQGAPASPQALLQLELSLSAFVADLQEVTNIIRSDIGLSAQLLRLATKENGGLSDKIVAISEIVVNVGVEKLQALVARTETLQADCSTHPELGACERFWMHARLTALVAEEIAGQSSDIHTENAYLAGLLCHIGELPSLLGRALPGSDAPDTRQVGYRMASAWGFPCDLADVIGGQREACRTPESRALLEIVIAADLWAFRLESLVASESGRSKPRIHLLDSNWVRETNAERYMWSPDIAKV